MERANMAVARGYRGSPGAPNPGHTGRTIRIAVALALSVHAYVLYYAFHYGTLSGLLQWDDCAIVVRGLTNLDQLVTATSGSGLLRAALHLDIHSPLSDLQTLIGLLLSGGQTWGPYVLNATWVALVLAAVLRTYERRDAVLAATAVLFILCQPLTVNALADLKSDWEGGLLLAGALFVYTRGAQTARADLKLWGAVLLGLATLSKLTAFYLPVVAAVAVLLYEWYAAVLEGRSIDRRLLVVRLLIAVGPFVLFFLAKLRPTIAYIRTATGSGWADGLSMLGRAWFYGPYGPDSAMEWGTLHVSCALLVGATLVVAWRRKDVVHPGALLVHGCVGAMLLAPLLVANSNHSFAATFLGVIVSATLISVDYLARSLAPRREWIVAALVVACILPAGLPFKNSNYYSQFPVTSIELRQIARTYGRIVDTMVAESRADAPHVIVFYDHVFAPHPNLSIEYFRKTGRLPSIDRVDDLADPRWKQGVTTADFVLTIVPNSTTAPVPNLYPTYPITKDPAAAESLVRAAGVFDPVGVFAVRGGEIHLYRNRGTGRSLLERRP